jgi:hypothetical protein
MKTKSKLFVNLLLILFLSTTIIRTNLAQVAEYEFYYSDYLVPGEILEWNVVTFVKEADVNWTLAAGHLVEEGDVIKFVIIKDPDTLNLTDPKDLQYNTKLWVNTYLNDINLSSVEEFDYFIDAFDEMGYVGPERHDTPDSPDRENFWKDLEKDMKPDCFNNESGILEVGITADLFNLKKESYESGETPDTSEPFVRNRSFEVSYNINWGYLDRMRVYEYYEQGAVGEEQQEILELVLENSRRTQKTPIKWASGLVALCIVGIITVHFKRKSNRQRYLLQRY